MADEVLFELLHSELVSYVQKNSEKDKKHGDLSTLEYVGFSSGYRIIERLTKEWPRFKDELDTMKFICTDFWSSINKKQIDNLRTNHQGVYVLQDNAFRFLTRLSAGRQYLEMAPKYVAFTCGLIRGALSNLGINSMVTAEVQSMPAYFVDTQFLDGISKYELQYHALCSAVDKKQMTSLCSRPTSKAFVATLLFMLHYYIYFGYHVTYSRMND